jgi:hypothetical protein
MEKQRKAKEQVIFVKIESMEGTETQSNVTSNKVSNRRHSTQL